MRTNSDEKVDDGSESRNQRAFKEKPREEEESNAYATSQSVLAKSLGENSIKTEFLDKRSKRDSPDKEKVSVPKLLNKESSIDDHSMSQLTKQLKLGPASGYDETGQSLPTSPAKGDYESEDRD